MTKEEESIGIGKLERSEIEQAVKEVLREKTMPCLSDLKERLLQSDELAVQKMGKILFHWCADAPYGKFIDQPTNLTLTKKNCLL